MKKNLDTFYQMFHAVQCIFNRGVSFHIEHLTAHNLQQCLNEENRLSFYKTREISTEVELENVKSDSTRKVVGGFLLKTLPSTILLIYRWREYAKMLQYAD